MTYCDYSDLPADQCACVHCKPLDRIPASLVVARFQAHFNTRCAACDVLMHAGDTICRLEDASYVHEHCVDPA